jgi:hypothetical protein
MVECETLIVLIFVEPRDFAIGTNNFASRQNSQNFKFKMQSEFGANAGYCRLTGKPRRMSVFGNFGFFKEVSLLHL